MGRKAKTFTKKELREIESLAGLGLTQAQIADVKDLCVDTLRKHANPALKRGRSRGVAKLAETAFKKALAGDTTMLIFLLKVIGGFSEKLPALEMLQKLLYGEEGDETCES